MSAYSHGRHEHGQNFLTNSLVIGSIVDRVTSTSGPIVEIGPGDGALTRRLAHTGRVVTAVDIDRRLTEKLRRELGDVVSVVNEDFLRFRLPATPHVVVGNIPFHITTAILRKLMHSPGWTDAVLLMQWEVARRRAGVGSSTMMTAQWAPWFTFELGERVPRTAFTPRPNVDGGVLHIRRRDQALLRIEDRKSFQSMVHAIYSGRGRGIVEIATRQGLFPSRRKARQWAEDLRLKETALPSQLDVAHMVNLFACSGSTPPQKFPPR